MYRAQLQRLHQSLCRWRTSTMGRIASSRFYIRQSSPSGDVPKQPHSNAYGTGGGPGGIAFSDSAPGGFRFLSPCRKEQRHSKELLGNVYNFMLNGTVTRFLPLPEGAHVRCHASEPSRLRGTPSPADAGAPSEREPLCTRVAMQLNIKKRAHDGRACCMLP